VYEVPADRNFVVGDITIGGRPIEFAAQMADFITIKLTGVGTRFGQSTVTPMTSCRRRKLPLEEALVAAEIPAFSVAAALEPLRTSTR
jgi:hypothetical protein